MSICGASQHCCKQMQDWKSTTFEPYGFTFKHPANIQIHHLKNILLVGAASAGTSIVFENCANCNLDKALSQFVTLKKIITRFCKTN